VTGEDRCCLREGIITLNLMILLATVACSEEGRPPVFGVAPPPCCSFQVKQREWQFARANVVP
jgi:hypothetical protein